MAVVALILVVVLFTLIVVRIRRHSVKRAAMGVGSQDGKHLTAAKIFSLITAFYLLGYVPFGLVYSGVASIPSSTSFFYPNFQSDVTNLVVIFRLCLKDVTYILRCTMFIKLFTCLATFHLVDANSFRFLLS